MNLAVAPAFTQEEGPFFRPRFPFCYHAFSEAMAQGTRRHKKKRWDDAKVWDIIKRLDAELKHLKKLGWRTSAEASPRFDKLRADYADALWEKDMAAFEAACLATLRLAYHDFRQRQRRQPS